MEINASDNFWLLSVSIFVIVFGLYVIVKVLQNRPIREPDKNELAWNAAQETVIAGDLKNLLESEKKEINPEKKFGVKQNVRK